jgi:hypothetical protein
VRARCRSPPQTDEQRYDKVPVDLRRDVIDHVLDYAYAARRNVESADFEVESRDYYSDDKRVTILTRRGGRVSRLRGRDLRLYGPVAEGVLLLSPLTTAQ